MIEVKIDGVVKWQVNEYTVVDPQMGIRSISLTVTHPSDNATVPSFVGAYVEYEGERYDIVNSKPTAEKGIDSINYKYNLIFNGQEAELQKRKIRNLATVGVDTFISQGTSFSLYADINQFKQLLENNLKYYFGSKWAINLGSTTSESVMVSVNNMFIWDLLLKTFEYYGLRWNITGNTINIGYTPDVIQHVFDYGYSGGLVKITRTAQSEPTINRLIGVGGSRNVPINYFTNRYSDFPVDPNPISGDVNIKNIMPKVFRDSVIAGTLPYTDYVEDAALVASEGVKEDALEPNEEIYPSIAGVEVTGLGRIDQIIAASVPTANTPDDAGYSPTFDIWVKDIGFDLADNQYTATQDAKISFTSGMLAGYEFVILATNGVRNVVVDTSKSYGGVASKYKITLINSSEDFTATGRMLPNSVIKAMAGDSFVIYDIIMPQTYVELAELRVQNWLNEQLLVKKVEKPTYAIEPTDTFFEENIAPESDGKTIREKLKSGNKLTVNNTKVTDGAQELHINNITIQYGGLLPKYSFVVTDKVSVQGSAIARLTNEIQKTDNSVQDTDKKIVKLQQYSDRQWKEIQETLTLLGQAVDGFSTGINPITIQTMQIIAGSESLQFRFVNSKTAPVVVSHAFNWDSATENFSTLSGIIQHMTLGITKISSSHPVSAYKFWDMASYSNNTLVPEKPYYLYAKCSRTTAGGVFILSDVAIGMNDDANYYHFLVGILNSQDADNERFFVSLYGYTEILPGRITTDVVASADGNLIIDLINRRITAKNGAEIVGKIKFTSGGSDTDLETWADGTSQDIQDAQSAANTANNNFDNLNQAVITELAGINNRFTSLQSQIDGEVSNWFYPYSPTLANYPASDWTTNAIKDRHVGDTFTNTAQAPATDAGKSWRFLKNGTVYSWTPIADSDAVKALREAAEARATADGKSTTFLVKPDVPQTDGYCYHFGDSWVLGADTIVNGIAYKSGEILTATQDSATFVEAHWVKKVRYTDDTAFDNQVIGGRNYFSVTNFVADNKARGYNTIEVITHNGNIAYRSTNIANNNDVPRYLQGVLEANTQYYLKFNIIWESYTDTNAQYVFIIRYTDGTSSTIIATTSQTSSELLTPSSKTIDYITTTRQFNGTVVVYNIQIKKENKLSDWVVSQEDVQASINTAKQEALIAAGNAQTSANNANTAVGDLNTYVDGSFKNGIIDSSEAKAIEKYINVVNSEKVGLEATYNKLYLNTYLEGVAKTTLLNSKVTYFGAVDALLNSINTAIADGKTTIAEKADVDSKYSSYKTTLASLQGAIEEANKAIQTKLDTLSTEKVDNLRIGVRNFYKKTTPLSAYWQQPPYTDISDRLQKIYNGFNYVGVSESLSLVRVNHVITGNGEWTVSFEVQSDVAGAPFYVDVCDLGKTKFYTPSVVGEWGKCELTVNVTNYGDGSVYNFVDFSDIQYIFFYVRNLMVVQGNKASESWTEAPEDMQVRIDEAKLTAEQAQLAADGYMRARYIRDWCGQNSLDTWAAWGEIKAVLKNGTNIAFGKAVEGRRPGDPTNVYSRITDGDKETLGHPSSAVPLGETDWVKIDLGQTYYDIDFIQVWHYYLDGRTYYGTKTEISVDGVNWTPVFDSAKSGTYKETALGNIISFRPNEVLAKTLKSQAITDKFGTTINGGLVSTVTTLLRELNSDIETAGMSGIRGANHDYPAFWTGTYANALLGLASIILRHNGTGKIGVLDVDANGSVKIMDGTLIRLLFQKTVLSTVADLLSLTQFGQTITNAASMSDVTGTTTLANTVSVTQSGSTLTFTGIVALNALLDTPHFYTSGSARTSVSLYKNGSFYTNLGTIEKVFTVSDDAINETYTINTSMTVEVGTYSVVIERVFQNVTSNSGGINNTSTLAWSLKKDIRQFTFGLDGFMAWYTNNHIHMSETGGLDVRGATNMPGVLAAGSSTAGGLHGNVWGAKSSGGSSVTPISGGFRVPLSGMGHNQYVVQVTPHTNATFMVGTKTAAYFEVFGTGGFDYVVIGRNYA